MINCYGHCFSFSFLSQFFCFLALSHSSLKLTDFFWAIMAFNFASTKHISTRKTTFLFLWFPKLKKSMLANFWKTSLCLVDICNHIPGNFNPMLVDSAYCVHCFAHFRHQCHNGKVGMQYSWCERDIYFVGCATSGLPLVIPLVVLFYVTWNLSLAVLDDYTILAALHPSSPEAFWVQPFLAFFWPSWCWLVLGQAICCLWHCKPNVADFFILCKPIVAGGGASLLCLKSFFKHVIAIGYWQYQAQSGSFLVAWMIL